MKALEKFIQRRYWILVDEEGVLTQGLDNLVYSTNKVERAHKYIKESNYTHTTVIDTKTGECFIYRNRSLVKHNMAKVIKRNQEEFQKLKQFSSEDKPPWD